MTGLRAPAFLALLAATLAAPAAAQAPFDMSPERDEAPVVDAPAEAGEFRMPFEVDPGTAPESAPAASPAPDPAPAPADEPDDPPVEEEYAGGLNRYLYPARSLRFEGEMGRQSWGIVLSAEQAARPVDLVVTYNSSIYVAPEHSDLIVSVNGQHVLQQPLRATQSGTRASVPLSSVLKAGVNTVSFTVVQRHRTDCTIQSTYDLWTEIIGSGSGLVFAGGDPPITSLGDLGAVGFDEAGATTIRLVMPGGERMLSDESILALVQALSLRGNFREPVVEVADSLLKQQVPGTLQIAIGTAPELDAIDALPAGAGRSSFAAMVSTAGMPPTIVLTGPDDAALDTAIRYVTDGMERTRVDRRSIIDTTPWHLPLVPMLTGDRLLSFSDLGIQTEEFTGRRYHAEFYIGLPSDFFAEAYGQATLLLDAAYTDAVKPGSSIDVYVNGFIASTMPLTSRAGDIFSHMPIKVAMTHFRPGVNRVTVEGTLFTDADIVCGPDGPAAETPRFAVFDTSEFHMPDFGRISRWPRLSALVGAGAPYTESTDPVHVVLGHSNKEIFGAAATFLARLAISGGTMIPAKIGLIEALGDEPAILVGTLDQFSAPVLTEMAIDQSARTDWVRRTSTSLSGIEVPVEASALTPGLFGETPQTAELVYDRWRKNVVNPGGLRGIWYSFESWLGRTFGLTFSALRVTAGPEPLYEPPDLATLIVAQSPAKTGRTRTLVAARSTTDLVESVRAIIQREYWSELSGRVSAFNATTGITSTPAEAQRFLLGPGWSLNNLRLVAANWLSVNIVAYALVLVVICIVLGVATSGLLARLGRRS